MLNKAPTTLATTLIEGAMNGRLGRSRSILVDAAALSATISVSWLGRHVIRYCAP